MSPLSVPSLEDFDRVIGLPAKGFPLSSEKVAQKLAEIGDPERLVGFDYTIGLLVAAGIGPGDFDVDLLPIIQKRAAGLARERVAREIRDKRNLTALATSFGVIVAVMLQSLPARADDGPVLSTTTGALAIAVLILLSAFMALRPRRKAEPDPHTLGFDREEWRQ
jgi:hypothetical protein